ncbi:MAG: hypothetical protein JXR68_03210 [Bacteroidales bacterium]|nr:hypothetical protein [Bacteroidales bacterium]
MQDNWQKFTDLHGGKHFSRDVFVEFCTEILDKHYPGKDIVLTSNFATYKSRRNTIVFLPKFFDNDLNSSRKGQIRNSFNSFVKDKENSKQKIYSWVVCMPYVLNEEELKWWLNWIDKQRDLYSINIELLDGNYLVELANKYDLFKKWFIEYDEVETSEVTEISSVVVSENIPNFELIDDSFNSDDEQKEEEVFTPFELIEDTDKKIVEDHTEEELEKTENTHNEEKDEVEKTENTHDEEKDEVEKTEDTHDEEKDLDISVKKNNPEPLLAKKLSYVDYVATFNRLKSVAENLLDEHKKDIAEINSKKDWTKAFDEIDIDNLPTLTLFYKAKSHEVHKNHMIAVFMYEKLMQKSDFDKILHLKIKEIDKSLKNCKIKTEAFLYELEGDLHFIRNNIAKAVVFYEKSYHTDNENKVVAKKYYETLADNQVKNDIPDHAIINYEKAINLDKSDKNTKLKLKNAKYLKRGNKFFEAAFLQPANVLFAPFAYMAAYSTIKEKSTKKKLNESLKRFYFVVALLLILLIIVGFAIKKSNLPEIVSNSFNKKSTSNNSVIVNTSSEVLFPVKPANIAFNEGVAILDCITYNKIHLIDTAISAFNRALTYTPGNVVIRKSEISFGSNFKSSFDSLAYKKYNEAKQYKSSYLTKVQEDILKDSAAYFISMRRYSDGLKLFKYTFEPHNAANGKYGYVDSLMNIIIPPMYDFDYINMYKGNESFINGKAFICLVTSTNDTIYYYINKQGKKQ